MHPVDDDTGCGLPCIETLVAGTLSLMTAWANPNPGAAVGIDTQRQLIARKIVSNLFFLQHHPHASASLRQVMTHVHGQWVGVATRAAAGGQAATVTAPSSHSDLH